MSESVARVGLISGGFAGVPSREELERFFFLDDVHRALVLTRRKEVARLGFAVQLGTVKFLGTFLDDPTGVPDGCRPATSSGSPVRLRCIAAATMAESRPTGSLA